MGLSICDRDLTVSTNPLRENGEAIGDACDSHELVRAIGDASDSHELVRDRRDAARAPVCDSHDSVLDSRPHSYSSSCRQFSVPDAGFDFSEDLLEFREDLFRMGLATRR
jgi:hypothetical protein